MKLGKITLRQTQMAWQLAQLGSFEIRAFLNRSSESSESLESSESSESSAISGPGFPMFGTREVVLRPADAACDRLWSEPRKLMAFPITDLGHIGSRAKACKVF